MELKLYQQRVVRESRAYLNALDEQYRNGNAQYASLAAWDACGVPRQYQSRRRNGLGKDLPTFCIKTPTGGGSNRSRPGEE